MPDYFCLINSSSLGTSTIPAEEIKRERKKEDVSREKVTTLTGLSSLSCLPWQLDTTCVPGSCEESAQENYQNGSRGLLRAVPATVTILPNPPSVFSPHHVLALRSSGKVASGTSKGQGRGEGTGKKKCLSACDVWRFDDDVTIWGIPRDLEDGIVEYP